MNSNFVIRAGKDVMKHDIHVELDIMFFFLLLGR